MARPPPEALEQAVGEFARSYPSTTPTVLARPVLEHFRDVSRLLDGPMPVARRQRLAVVADHLAGLAGGLAFDLLDEGKALAYFKVAVRNLVVGTLSQAGSSTSPPPPYVATPTTHILDEGLEARGSALLLSTGPPGVVDHRLDPEHVAHPDDRMETALARKDPGPQLLRRWPTATGSMSG